MTDLVADASGVAQDIEALGKKMEQVVETALAVVSSPSASNSGVASDTAAASNDDLVLSVLKSVIAVDGVEPKAWDALLALAKAKAAGAGLDAVITALLLLLPLSGTKLVAPTETVAAAKAIAAA